MMKQVDEFLASLGAQHRGGPRGTSVPDLTDDSRRVTAGSLFVARGPLDARAAGFVRDALARGAAAVLTEAPGASEAPIDPPGSVAWYTADRVDQPLAGELAERFFGRPSEKLRLIGVTGTNGKTTTAYLIQHLLVSAGLPTGLIGTVCTDTGGPSGPRPAELTTPGAIELSRLLAEMVAHGCQAAVMEASSHALDQGRMAAMRFDAAVFTNLTGDHLDYHGTMDAYADAKARLFEQLGPWGQAVLSADGPYAARMARAAAGRSITWTTLDSAPPAADAPADPEPTRCRAQVLALAATHSRVRFQGPWGSLEIDLPMVGRHNVSNALQAAAAVNAVGGGVARTLRDALRCCPPVPGRLEPVRLRPAAGPEPAAAPSDDAPLPHVLVDYAHSHDSLQNVLTALRQVAPARLVVVFGCGGDRDRTKRPKMAEAACRLADRIVLTSDNPRTEDPEAIIADALAGVPAPRRADVEVIPDRAQAIRLAITTALPDDTVLLAGKGHEDYQVVGREKLPFDDRSHAAAALAQWRQEWTARCRLSI